MLTAFTDEAERGRPDRDLPDLERGGRRGRRHAHRPGRRTTRCSTASTARHLVVSTKYTLGDFYSHLPLNDTLETGDQRRIVELQSRREFEAYGALPNDLGNLYQQALQRFLAANPHVEGIWTWTQDGGPWRAGPMTLELDQRLLAALRAQHRARPSGWPATPTRTRPRSRRTGCAGGSRPTRRPSGRSRTAMALVARRGDPRALHRAVRRQAGRSRSASSRRR